MTKQRLVSILFFLTEFLAQTVSISHHASKGNFRHSKVDAKKSIIPRHESDTKYGGLFRVIEPSEEIDKRSRFGQIGNTANQLHKLERFIAGYSRGNSQKSRKKSDISRGRNPDSKNGQRTVSHQRESNENIALIRNIIEKMSRNKDIQNSVDDSQHFTKKQDIQPALNTQKENKSAANEVKKIENTNPSLRDEASYGSSPTNPGMSCSDIFQKYPNFPSGVYWIKSADGKERMRIYCEKATDGFTYVKPVLNSGKEWKPIEKSNSTEPKDAGKTKIRKVIHAVVGDHMQMGDNPQLKEENEPEDPDQIKSGMWPYDPLSTLLPAVTNGSDDKQAQSTNTPALKLNNNNFIMAEPQNKTYSDEAFSGAAISENKTANNSAITDSNNKAPSNETGASNSSSVTTQGVESKGQEEINKTDSWAIGARASDSKPSGKTDTSSSSEIQPTKTPTVAKGVTAMKPTAKQAKMPDTLEEYENERKKDDSAANSSTSKKENSNHIAPGKNENLDSFAGSVAPSTISTVDYANYGLLGDIPGATARQIEPTAALSEKDNTPTLKKNGTSVENNESKEKDDTLNKTDAAKEKDKESSTVKPDDKEKFRNTSSKESQGLSPEQKKASGNSTNKPEKQLAHNSSLSTNKETKSINGTSEDKQKANATENNYSSNNTNTENRTDTKPTKPASDNVLNSKASYQYIENTTTPLDNTEYHESLGRNSTNTASSKEKERNPDNSSLAQNFFPPSKPAEAENRKPDQSQVSAPASLQTPVSSSNQVAAQMSNLNNIHQIVPTNPINSIQSLAALPLSHVSSGNPQFFVNSPALNENSTTLTSALPVNPVTGDRTLNSSVSVVALKGDEGTISEAPLNGIPTADLLKSKDMLKHTQLKFVDNFNNKNIADYDIYDVGRKKSILEPKLENSKRSHKTFNDLDKALAGTNFSIQNGVSTQLTFKSNIDDENQGKIVNEEKRSVIQNEIVLTNKKKYKRSWEKKLAKISDSLQGSNLSIQNNVDSRLTFKSRFPQVRLTAENEPKAKVKKSSILGKIKQSALSGNTFCKDSNSSKDSNCNEQRLDQDQGLAKDPAKDQSTISVKDVSKHSVNDENVLKAVLNVQTRNESEAISNKSNSISLHDIKHHEIDQNNVLHAVFNVRENSQNNTQGNAMPPGSSNSTIGGTFMPQDQSQTTARAKIEQQKITRPKLKQQLTKSNNDNAVLKRKKSEDQYLEVKNASKVASTTFNVAIVAKTDVSLGAQISGKYKTRNSKNRNQAKSTAREHSKSKRLKKWQKKKSSQKSPNLRIKDPVKKYKNSKFQGSDEKRLIRKVSTSNKTLLARRKLKNTNSKKKKKESTKLKRKKIAKYPQESLDQENGNGISKKIAQPQLFMKRQEVTVQTSSFKISQGNRQLIPTEIGKMEPSESERKEQSDRAETITKNSKQPSNDNSLDFSHQVNTGSALYNEAKNTTSNNSTSATSNQTSGDNASFNNGKAIDLAQPAKSEEQNKFSQNQAGPENTNTNSSIGLAESQEKMPDLNQILNFTVGFLNKTFHEHFKEKQASGDKTEKSNSVANNSSTNEGHQVVAGSNNNGNQQNSTAAGQPLPLPQSQNMNSTANNSISEKGNATTSPALNYSSNATGSGSIANDTAQLSKSQKVPGTASAAAVSDMMSPVENYILNMINTSGAEHFGNGSSGSGKRDSNQVSETANQDQKQNDGNVLNVLNPSNLGDISKLGNLHITSNEYSISFTPKNTGKSTTTNESVKEGANSKLINPASKKGKIENSTQKRKSTSKRLNSTILAKGTGGEMKSMNARKIKDSSQADDKIQVNAKFTTAHRLQRISSSSKGSSSASSRTPRENTINYKSRKRNDQIRNILHKKNIKNKINKSVTKKTNDQENSSKQGNSSSTNGFPIKIEGKNIDWGPVSENWPNFGLG